MTPKYIAATIQEGKRKSNNRGINIARYALRIFGKELGNSPHKLSKEHNPYTYLVVSSGKWGGPKWMRIAEFHINREQYTNIDDLLKEIDNIYKNRNHRSKLKIYNQPKLKEI